MCSCPNSSNDMPAPGCMTLSVADLMLWVSKGISFVVIDAETGEDITRILLA